MNGPPPGLPRYFGTIGCLTLAFVLMFLCLLPFALVDLMHAALGRLHLSADVALLAVVGIFLGSLVNLPVYRIQRGEEQIVGPAAVVGLWDWPPQWRRVRRDTIIAINVGGCVIPTALAVWEILYISRAARDSWPVIALAAVVAANVVVCWRVARPVHGVGIAMPGFAAALTAVLGTWLLLAGDAYAELRAPVAFVSGVAGPLVGADLLHLKDITKVSAGMLSIGGAGTFDGIVLSGLLAALLA
jgi:uncharacterized membrane protein